jgi:hypothetical protein
MSKDAEGDQDGGLPRPLTTLEQQVMAAILKDDWPGARELRAQLDTVRVTDNWAPSGSPSISLEVPSDAPAAPLDERMVPVETQVYDEQGNYIGELIVWLSNGRLSGLEYTWVTDEMPLSLPTVEMLRVLVDP